MALTCAAACDQGYDALDAEKLGWIYSVGVHDDLAILCASSRLKRLLMLMFREP